MTNIIGSALDKMAAVSFFGFLVPTFNAGVIAQDVETNGRVCGYPTTACTKIFGGPNDLAFIVPAKLKWQTNYRSSHFYAIILKSRLAINDDHVDADRCKQGYFPESERKRIQALFPKNKVFTTRNGCYMPSIWYTNVDSKYEFVAVFAGITEGEARTLIKTVKALGFTDANVRKMQVVLGYGD